MCVTPDVFLCDEPTANVDLASDERIHSCLLSLDATVMMVCHRLKYIRRFHLVAVMDRGRIVELADPVSLLSDPSSRLSHLHGELEGS